MATASVNTRYDVHPLWKEADPQAFLARHGHEFSGYVTSARFGLSDATLAAMPELKDALVEALEQGTIAGAGLDVYADEPHVPARLLALEQVVLLPHLASATHETRQAMANLVLKNLDSYFTTGAVRVAAA